MKVEDLLKEEKHWKDYVSTLDSGSYCESASIEYQSARKILKALRDLIDSLIDHERHYDLPKELTHAD